MKKGGHFEKDFKDSIEDYMFYYRFRDGTANFGGASENVRFQQTNICDCMVYHKKLYLFELKSHKGKSIPLTCIRDNQVDGLLNASRFDGIEAGLLLNFSDLDETYYMDILKIRSYINTAERKSFPVAWCREEGIKVKQQKKIKHFRYDIATLLIEINNKDLI
ncbi:MAG: hypothetical protein GX638_19235 [Crenarchaeota archaeon]|nr:hypothetical protein [Thermoproteota archaeon]